MSGVDLAALREAVAIGPEPWRLADDGSACVYQFGPEGFNRWFLHVQTYPGGVDDSQRLALAKAFRSLPALLARLDAAEAALVEVAEVYEDEGWLTRHAPAIRAAREAQP